MPSGAGNFAFPKLLPTNVHQIRQRSHIPHPVRSRTPRHTIKLLVQDLVVEAGDNRVRAGCAGQVRVWNPVVPELVADPLQL